MMKYLWGLLCGLGVVGPHLQCARCLNVVMATDGNYVVPTAVAMNSLIEAEKVSGMKLRFVIFVDKATKGEQHAWSELHDHLLTQMKQVNPERVEVNLLDITNFRDPLLDAATKKYNNRLIALRLVFPKIWKNQKLPGVSAQLFKTVRSFLWLDSDVLVMKPLEPLLDEVGYEAEEGIRQPVISANLDFIYSKGDGKSRYHNYGIRSHAGWIPSDKIETLDEEGSARVSGGLLVYKLDCMPEKLRCFPRNQRRHSRPTTKSVLTQCCDVSSWKTEEGVFDVLLQRSQDQAYFFSTLYNCRPGYVPVAQDFLRNFPNLSADQSCRTYKEITVYRSQQNNRFYRKLLLHCSK